MGSTRLEARGLGGFYEKPSDPVNCVIVFTKKGASGAKHQIRTAAPHFEMGLGHEWANFNTQSVQTLKFSRFVASRGSANHDGWHGFSKFYETPSDSVIYLIYFTKKRASGTKHQIRTAAPHLEIGFEH